METQHNLFLRISGNRLYFPKVENPRKILECGYGRGEWAVAVAEAFEECEVSCIHSASWQWACYSSQYQKRSLSDEFGHIDGETLWLTIVR